MNYLYIFLSLSICKRVKHTGVSNTPLLLQMKFKIFSNRFLLQILNLRIKENYKL